MGAPKNLGQEVQKRIADGESYKKICNDLGISKGTCSYHAKKCGSHRPTGPKPKYNWEEIQIFYDNQHSLLECKDKYKFSPDTLTKAINSGKLKIDITRSPGRGRARSFDVICEVYSGKRGGSIRGNIRKSIVRDGIFDENICAICGITEWLGQKLTMRLDHIDGNGGNHNKENLRFVCPNCDSILPTYCYRNRGRYKYA